MTNNSCSFNFEGLLDLVNVNDLGGVKTDSKFFTSAFKVNIILALFDNVVQSSAGWVFGLIIECAFSTRYSSVLAMLSSDVWYSPG